MTRRPALALAAAVALAGSVALVPVRAETIHRHQFNGRHKVLVRGEANVRVEEQEHDISTLSFKSQPSSEHIKLTAEAATGDAAYIHYYYDTPPAPVTELLTAGVWVKATKAGIQLRARVVFPNEPDPANPQSPLTTLIIGATLDKSRKWDKLTLENVPELLGKHLPVLRAKIGRDVNATGAYIDRLVLNLYTGPGATEVWVDDLDIGPVKPAAEGRGRRRHAGETPARPREPHDRGRSSRSAGRSSSTASRSSSAPSATPARRSTSCARPGSTRSGCRPTRRTNSSPTPAATGWLIVPTIPLVPRAATTRRASTWTEQPSELDAFMRKFGTADVLFWDLGGGRTGGDEPRVARTCEAIRRNDPRRPRGADVWDGFSAYSSYLDVVGAHRWPLFTSLDMAKYRDWLTQRQTLTATPRATYWTWVQNHLPDWYLANVLEQKEPFNDPIGPHPEQVRVMAYIAMASGARGLGFWSDRFLADSHHGRDRLQGMALLNSEIDMLSPVLTAQRHSTRRSGSTPATRT